MFSLRDQPLKDRSAEARRLERRRMVVAAAAGAMFGIVLGAVLVMLVDRGRITGTASHASVFVGLPLSLAVIGAVLGLLLSLAGRSRPDAPVREWRYVLRRRAATGIEGDTGRHESGRRAGGREV